MAKFLLKINRDALCKLIVLTLLNKFDFFLVVEGNTGTGKSTLSIHIARGVKREFKKLFALNPETVEYYYEKVIKKQNISMEEFCLDLLQLKKEKAYNYNPYKDLVYDQKSMIRGLSSWQRIIIPDEMINITFNRDFQGEDQKNIIKLINMYRDHNNLIIASVPQFQNLDVQIKNLTKMRISIAKRGVGILQTPNKIIYGKDKWDSANNEKIEREWLLRGGRPKYTKLTTSRGLVHFPPLTKLVEAEYQDIKNKKRSNIVEKDMGIVQEKEKQDPMDYLYERLTTGKIKNTDQLEGIAQGFGLDTESVRHRLRRRLNKDNKNDVVSSYYWSKKSQKDDLISIK